MKNKAFSLIELLVVITIIAILAAIAIPSYQQYKLRSVVLQSYNLLFATAESASVYYGSKGGKFPPSLTIGSTNVVCNGTNWYFVGFQNIFSAYCRPSPDGFGLMIMAQISGLNGIPNYTAPFSSTPPLTSGANLISIGIRDTSSSTGAISYACGIDWTGYANGAIPSAYLPPSCNSTSVCLFYYPGGGGTNGC